MYYKVIIMEVQIWFLQQIIKDDNNNNIDDWLINQV